MPILVFLGLSVLELGPMYATDVRQTDVRQKHRYGGGGIINHNKPKTALTTYTDTLPTKTTGMKYYHTQIVKAYQHCPVPLLISASVWAAYASRDYKTRLGRVHHSFADGELLWVECHSCRHLLTFSVHFGLLSGRKHQGRQVVHCANLLHSDERGYIMFIAQSLHHRFPPTDLQP